jgi:hypothetical protein
MIDSSILCIDINHALLLGTYKAWPRLSRSGSLDPCLIDLRPCLLVPVIDSWWSTLLVALILLTTLLPCWTEANFRGNFICIDSLSNSASSHLHITTFDRFCSLLYRGVINGMILTIVGFVVDSAISRGCLQWSLHRPYNHLIFLFVVSLSQFGGGQLWLVWACVSVFFCSNRFPKVLVDLTRVST